MDDSVAKASIWRRSPILRMGHWVYAVLIRISKFLISPSSLKMLLIVIVFVCALYVEEDWRGRRAWQEFKRTWEAKGERFESSAFIPPPVPDEQNFAMTPLFAALFDYSLDPSVKMDPFRKSPMEYMRRGNTNAFNRTSELSVYRNRSQPPTDERLSLHTWESGEATDLAAWQSYYRGSTNFPVAAQPQGPPVDVLLALSKFEDPLQEIRTASQRPYSRFPVRYRENHPFTPHYSVLRDLTRILVLRAVCELRQGRSEEAFGDLRLCFRLADSVRGEPLLISPSVRRALLLYCLQPVWEGLDAHRWNNQQLSAIQEYLQGVDLLSDCERNLRCRRADINRLVNELAQGNMSTHSYLLNFTIIDTLGSFEDAVAQPLPGEKMLQLYLWCAPRGWIDGARLEFNRTCQDEIFALVSSQAQRVYPFKTKILSESLRRSWKKAWPPSPLTALPASCSLVFVNREFAFGQTAVDEARVACALEQYRQANGSFPSALRELVPGFIEKLPHDIVDGQPLRYHRTQDGAFILYSVGWDALDDGGLASKKPLFDDKGDWVWRYPIRGQ